MSLERHLRGGARRSSPATKCPFLNFSGGTDSDPLETAGLGKFLTEGNHNDAEEN